MKETYHITHNIKRKVKSPICWQAFLGILKKISKALRNCMNMAN